MSASSDVRELARLHGVLESYRDAGGVERHATDESILAVLRALDVPALGTSDVGGAIAEAIRAPWRRGIEPVTVQWDGGGARLDLRLPERLAEEPARIEVDLEGGGTLALDVGLADLAPDERVVVDGEAFVRKVVPVPAGAGWGRHRLSATIGRARHEGWLLSAPSRAYPLEERTWGVFAPVHALRSARSLGAGSLGDLDRLAGLVAARGGRVVATLPLLSAFLDEPCEPSPYSPVSRLFWNELHLDVAALPEAGSSRRCGALLSSPGIRAEIEALRAAPLVDHRRQYLLQRRVLECVAESLGPARESALEAFGRERPGVFDYALFRGACEKLGTGWARWPASARDGELRASHADAAAVRYHAVAQWLTEQQLGRVATSHDAGLYLDLPIGVHPDGYDAWRERDAFGSASAGAPPDALYSKGQDWGLRPLHPARIREQGYRYFADCLARPMRFARMLRIDHVMALQRLYWVPEGFGAQEGVYVRYRRDEMLAVACLESHRNACGLVGENLGTVPPGLDDTLRGAGIGRLHVVQYALAGGGGPRAPEPGEISSVNTHDMPTFAGFVGAADATLRVELGLAGEEDPEREREARARAVEDLARGLEGDGLLPPGERSVRALHEAVLASLGRSPAACVIATLEDVWLEAEPQNVPGTFRERPNWRRRMKRSLEEIASDEDGSVERALGGLARARREPGTAP